jgi:glycine cleavage system H protein
MDLPAGLKFTESHEWIRTEPDGVLTVGITDHAQAALGDLVYIELPDVGRQLAKGEATAVVESVKAASDVYAPASGEVIAVNDALSGAPESVNADAWGAWLFKLKPANPADMAGLLDADGYRASVGEA